MRSESRAIFRFSCHSWDSKSGEQCGTVIANWAGTSGAGPQTESCLRLIDDYRNKSFEIRHSAIDTRKSNQAATEPEDEERVGARARIPDFQALRALGGES